MALYRSNCGEKEDVYGVLVVGLKLHVDLLSELVILKGDANKQLKVLGDLGGNRSEEISKLAGSEVTADVGGTKAEDGYCHMDKVKGAYINTMQDMRG